MSRSRPPQAPAPPLLPDPSVPPRWRQPRRRRLVLLWLETAFWYALSAAAVPELRGLWGPVAIAVVGAVLAAGAPVRRPASDIAWPTWRHKRWALGAVLGLVGATVLAMPDVSIHLPHASVLASAPVWLRDLLSWCVVLGTAQATVRALMTTYALPIKDGGVFDRLRWFKSDTFDSDPDATSPDGPWPLPVSAIQVWLETGVDPNARGPDGTPLLTEAIANFATEAALVLLAGGADPNAVGPDGGTALMAAAKHHRLPVMRALLEAGADPTARDSFGSTALMEACDLLQSLHTRDALLACRMLCEAGADPLARKRCKKGTTKTALDVFEDSMENNRIPMRDSEQARLRNYLDDLQRAAQDRLILRAAAERSDAPVPPSPAEEEGAAVSSPAPDRVRRRM